MAAAGRRVFRLSFVSGLLLVLADSEATGTGECVHGLCTFTGKSLVAGRPPLSRALAHRVSNDARGGVCGFEFTAVPVPVATTSK